MTEPRRKCFYHFLRRRYFGPSVMHRLEPSTPTTLLVGLWRFFGLIFWSFRLDGKNLTARGVNANLFCVFRSGFRYIDGPEAVSSRSLQFRTPNAAAWHLG